VGGKKPADCSLLLYESQGKFTYKVHKNVTHSSYSFLYNMGDDDLKREEIIHRLFDIKFHTMIVLLNSSFPHEPLTLRYGYCKLFEGRMIRVSL